MAVLGTEPVLTVASGDKTVEGKDRAIIMSTVCVERPIAADPSSVALLLSGPTGVALWPGVQNVQEAGEPTRVLADVPGRGRVRVDVSTAAPVRTPTAFVVAFRFDGEVPATSGALVLDFVAAADGSRPTTRAALRLAYPGPEPDRLRSLASAFLDNLATVAEQRSHAA